MIGYFEVELVLDAFRNFLLIGTAYPETFQNVAKGVDQIPCHDWLFYRTLHDVMPTNVRLPNFGDYTTVHPNFKAIDMRLINPAGKLVYTTPEVLGSTQRWFVSK